MDLNDRRTRFIVIGAGAFILIVIILAIFALTRPAAEPAGFEESTNIHNETADENAQITAKQYPITAILPFYSNNNWAVRMPDTTGEFKTPPDGYSMPYFLYVDTVLDGSDQRASIGAQQSILEAQRAQALDWIKSRGFNPDDFAFYYTEPYLQAKYGTTVPKP